MASYSVRITTQTHTWELTVAQSLETVEAAEQIGEQFLAIPGTMLVAYELWETTTQRCIRHKRVNKPL